MPAGVEVGISELTEAEATGTRPEFIRKLTPVDVLVIEDLGMRRLPSTAAEDLVEIFTRRYETGQRSKIQIKHDSAGTRRAQGPGKHDVECETEDRPDRPDAHRVEGCAGQFVHRRCPTKRRDSCLQSP